MWILAENSCLMVSIRGFRLHFPDAASAWRNGTSNFLLQTRRPDYDDDDDDYEKRTRDQRPSVVTVLHASSSASASLRLEFEIWNLFGIWHLVFGIFISGPVVSGPVVSGPVVSGPVVPSLVRTPPDPKIRTHSR